MTQPIVISHYSDVLCVWAYVAQVRLDELTAQFGNKVKVNHIFIPLFGSTEKRIGEGWKDRGGFNGFSDHVVDVCGAFPHIKINPKVWKSCRPLTSASSHCFIKAVQLLEESNVISGEAVEAFKGKTLAEEFVWRIRLAFFVDAEDISSYEVMSRIAQGLNIDLSAVDEKLKSGEAIAALCRDAELKELHKIEGSPTYYLNGGRQKLYGNVGYKILEANVLELLQNKGGEVASWC